MDTRTASVQAVTKHLRIIFRVVQSHSKAIEKKCGLSGAMLWMLHEIGANPGLKVSELAAALTIHPSTCSNMLDKLESRALVARDRSKRDQRAVHLNLTAEGERLLAMAPQPAQGTVSGALTKLSDSQLSTLEQGLEALVLVLQDTNERDGLVPLFSE